MLCSRVRNQLSAYCDRELTGVEMLHLRRHLDDCPACHRELVTLRHVKALYGALPGVEPSRAFQPAMLDRPARSHVLAWLDRLSAAGAAFALRPSARRAGRALTHLAAGAALAAAMMGGYLLQQPRPADAVTAHVPEVIAADAEATFGRPALAPPFEAVYAGSVMQLSSPRIRPTSPALQMQPVNFMQTGPEWRGR